MFCYDSVFSEQLFITKLYNMSYNLIFNVAVGVAK